MTLHLFLHATDVDGVKGYMVCSLAMLEWCKGVQVWYLGGRKGARVRVPRLR